jgi:hypothetical protein
MRHIATGRDPTVKPKRPRLQLSEPVAAPDAVATRMPVPPTPDHRYRP